MQRIDVDAEQVVTARSGIARRTLRGLEIADPADARHLAAELGHDQCVVRLATSQPALEQPELSPHVPVGTNRDDVRGGSQIGDHKGSDHNLWLWQRHGGQRSIALMLAKLVVQTPRKLAEVVSAALFAAGAGGIEELDGSRRLIVYAESREGAERIAARTRELLRESLPGPMGIKLSVEVDERSDWASAWTQYLRQIALTPHLVIQPQWDETPAPDGTRRILYDPKLSFGDGAHETTRLAAAMLERLSAERLGTRLLDFGSGTGVLSFVALLSGVGATWGVDIDPVSVEAAQHNAALNGLAEAAWFGLPAALDEQHFDWVVANLEAPTLLASAPEIMRLAVDSDRLIVTGFLAAREAEVAAAFASKFSLHGSEYEADWALLEFAPKHE
jgi:ribosomal protein L11 methyltransferase